MASLNDDAGLCAIAVMAKAPLPGRCKTRLTPPLSPQQAAAMSAAFLRDITENMALAAQALPIARYVAYAPDGLAHCFDGILAEGTRLILADGRPEVPPGVAGFGRCLLHAVQALLAANHPAACVLNADSPTLPTGMLRRAARILLAPGDRAVLGPAEDGGYYLLGMKHCHAGLFTGIDWSTDRVADQTRERARENCHAGLFTGIDWSTDRVADQTRERAREIGLELVELPSWYDVDDAASLERLRHDLARSIGYAAPLSALALAALTEHEGAHP